MPADHENENQNTNGERKIPDFAQLFKEMYFQSEEAWARAVKEFVASQSFIPILEQISGQYLSLYKATSESMDRYLANYPIPTKKDIARVAELVVSVEDKVDDLENQISSNVTSLADSLIKLVEYQTMLKDELAALRQDVHLLQDRINPMTEERGIQKAADHGVVKEENSSQEKASLKAGPDENKDTKKVSPRARRSKKVLSDESQNTAAIKVKDKKESNQAPPGRQGRSKKTTQK